jgi:hypothetical protein
VRTGPVTGSAFNRATTKGGANCLNGARKQPWFLRSSWQQASLRRSDNRPRQRRRVSHRLSRSCADPALFRGVSEHSRRCPWTPRVLILGSRRLRRLLFRHRLLPLRPRSLHHFRHSLLELLVIWQCSFSFIRLHRSPSSLRGFRDGRAAGGANVALLQKNEA